MNDLIPFNGDVKLDNGLRGVCMDGKLVSIINEEEESWGTYGTKPVESSGLKVDSRKICITLVKIERRPIKAPEGKIYHKRKDSKMQLIEMTQVPEEIRRYL